MRDLSAQELADILTGATILGTGGGGSLAGGLEIIAGDLAAGRVFRPATLDELPDDAWAACPYVAGSVSPLSEQEIADYAHLPRIDDSEAMAAFEALERSLGRRFEGVLTTELGGENTADALAVAARLGRSSSTRIPRGAPCPSCSTRRWR